MSTLSDKDCAIFGRTMKAVPRIELCAGNKVKIKPPISFVKFANGTLAHVPPTDSTWWRGQTDEYYLGEFSFHHATFASDSLFPMQVVKTAVKETPEDPFTLGKTAR